ncbi:MAG: nucleotidyltransferase domain-containing protein [bacterium]
MLAVDELPVRFVMTHSDLGDVDFHPVTFDERGTGIQAQPGGGTFRYPAEGFGGSGTILGRAVPCLTPEVQVLCHRGYEPKEKDFHDVVLLHKTFGVPLPRGYCAARSGSGP